nr:MAG: coat protein [brine shrimp noda-like virus 2]
MRRKSPAKKKKQPVSDSQSVTAVGSLLRHLGGLGGTALGTMVGAPTLGGAAGNQIAAALSRWLGAGDYTVGTNSIVHRMRTASSIPAMHSTNQTVVVRHKEYVGEIKGSTGFAVRDSLVLNPGNRRTFPWLSGIARNYQEYSFKGIVFHYIPTSGTAVSGSNPSLGSVMMQTSYRSNDVIPASKAELLNEYCSNEACPADAFVHPIECDPAENPFNVQYVRTGALPASDSQLMYDLGQTHVAVSGQLESDHVIGDLWVTYEVELKKPILASNVTSKNLSAYYTNSLATSSSLFSGAVLALGSNVELGLSGNTITFPKGSAGHWQISILITADTTFSAVNTWGTIITTNCIAVNWHPSLMGSPASVPVLGGSSPTLTNVSLLSGIYIEDPAVEATWNLPSVVLTGSVDKVYLAAVEVTVDIN